MENGKKINQLLKKIRNGESEYLEQDLNMLIKRAKWTSFKIGRNGYLFLIFWILLGIGFVIDVSVIQGLIILMTTFTYWITFKTLSSLGEAAQKELDRILNQN